VLYLLQQEKMSFSDLQDLLYHRSGLLGVSGISGDVRTLLASDTKEAKEAHLTCLFIAPHERWAVL
jgi:acetate kinase